MDTVVKRLYEGLFLVDSGEATADWEGINKAIEQTLAKADAEIVSMKKWDERKLAYDINGKSRGTYILTYFRGDPSKLGVVERSVQLSERIMRMLILRTDKMSPEDMEKVSPLPTPKVAEVPAEAAKVDDKASKKAEPEKTEPEKAEPEKAEPEKAEPEKAEPEKTEPEKTEPEKTEPEKAEPEKTEPTKVEAAQDSSDESSSGPSEGEQKVSEEPPEAAPSESEPTEK